MIDHLKNKSAYIVGDIALFFDELLADYVFHIDYFNPYSIDTILFAVPIERE